MRRLLVLVVLLAAREAGAAGPGRSEFTLPNGLRVRLAPARDEKEVIVILGVRAGFFAEPSGKPHIAHVAEHVVVFGARPGSGEAKAMDRWSAEGRANGETLAPLMYFDLHVRPDDLAAALRVQAGRLAGPAITREGLDREVPRALGEVERLDRSDEGYTSKFAAMAFVQAALRGDPHIPLRARTRGFTPEDVRAFWSGAARPDRAILCVAGAFDPEEARKEVEAAFGPIPAPAGPSTEPPPKLRPGRLDATWDLRARHLLLAWPAPPASDPDHPALTVAAQVLTQRLFTDPDVASLARLPFVSNDADGLLLINAYVRPGADAEALEARILDRVGKLSGQGAPTDAEVAQVLAAVGQMLGSVDVDAIALPPGMSRSLVRANVELQRLVKESSWGDPSSYKARVDAVGARAVRDAAARYFAPSKATIVRLGPGR